VGARLRYALTLRHLAQSGSSEVRALIFVQTGDS